MSDIFDNLRPLHRKEAQKIVDKVLAEGGTVMDPFHLDYSSIEIGEKIGEGSFGEYGDEKPIVPQSRHSSPMDEVRQAPCMLEA